MDKKQINFSGEFINLQDELNFRETIWPQDIKPLILICLIVIIVSLCENLNDIMLFNFSEKIFFLISLKGILFFSGILTIIYAIHEPFTPSISFIASIFIISTGLYISGNAIVNKNSFLYPLPAMSIITILFYCFANFRLAYIIIANFLSSSIFITANIFFISDNINIIIVNTIFLVIANIFGITAFIRFSYFKRMYFYEKKEIINLRKEIVNEIEKNNDLKNQIQGIEKTEENIEKAEKNIEKDEFSTHLESEFEKSIKYKSDLSLIIVEINNFHSIKTKLGEKITEIVLNDVSKIFSDKTKYKGDFFKRTSENEFIFILPSTDEYGAFSFYDKISSQITKRAYKIKNKIIKLTTNAGIICRDDEKTPSDFIKKARKKLAESKKNKNRDSLFL